MKPLVPFAVLQAALCGFSCYLVADGRFSTYGEWSGVGAAFFACGWLLWSLAALALWTDRDDLDTVRHSGMIAP